MILEQQVCTLEQSKKLAELGIDQKTALYFWDKNDWQLYRSVDGSATDVGCFAAYTVAELMTMLPSDWALWTDEGHYTCGQYHDIQNLYMLGKTAAEAVAAELIVLIEGEIISVEECNKRLNQ